MSESCRSDSKRRGDVENREIGEVDTLLEIFFFDPCLFVLRSCRCFFLSTRASLYLS
jgi:hypothetical protein